MRNATVAALAVLSLVGTQSALADPIADRAAARELLAAENWPAAAAAFRGLTAVDPNQGIDWYYLGAALARSGDCAGARPALERAIALGVNGARSGLRRAHVDAAACAAALGDADAALGHLSIAQARYGFAAFENERRLAPLAGDVRFQRLAGQPQQGLERVTAWRADLDYYVDLVERRHPNPYHVLGETAWRAAVADLRLEIQQANDFEIVGGFMRLASMVGDGHTMVLPPVEGPLAGHLLPIWPYHLGDDWYVVAAAPERADLVGARILGVAGRPIGELTAQINALLPRDNEMTMMWLGAQALQFAEIATLAAGASPSSEVVLDIEDAAGVRRSVTLQGGPIDRDPTTRWTPQAWPTMGDAQPAPLWLSRVNEAYFTQDIDGGRTIYAQINQIGDGGERTYEQFVTDLGVRIRASRARRLVIDLRHNSGGSNSLNWALVREIVRSQQIDREGGLFVIVGRRTFSAAMNLASMLETHTDAIFVGEPTGSRPNFYGEDTPFTLPHSRLTGSISSAWFQGGQTSDDTRPFIAPGLFAPLTAADLRAGRDPAMVAIDAYVSEHQH